MTIRPSRIIIAAVIVLLLLGGLAWFWLGQSAEEPQKAFSLSKVTRGNIVATVSATGTLSPVITVQVGSQVSGTIQHLYVDFNSRVKKGDLIAQIDPALFKARLAEAQANFKSAEAARDKAWIAVLDAKRQLERLQKQQKQKLVSESDVDAARFAYDAAVVEHKIKIAAADQAKAARDREQVNLAYTSIYAPIDGVVISRNVDVGQTVAASLQAPTLFTIAQDLTRMQIETEVDEAFIGMIEPEQPVRFTVFAYQKRQFSGQVAQVRLNPTIEAGVVKYNCVIYVDNSDLALKPGMTATVTIEVARSDNVLNVSNAALRYLPDWPAPQLKKLSAEMDLKPNEGVVWVPKGNQGEELKPVKVIIGTAGEKETQISGDGIQEGMRVAVPPGRQDNERRRRFGLSLF
jgi:HlyD family secretion protein